MATSKTAQLDRLHNGLMEAARVAQTRSGGDDVKKRLMVVPDVHVTRLVTAQRNGTTRSPRCF